MNTLQTGEEQARNYSQGLSNSLRQAEERYDLATAEMEALTAWASTGMENPSRSLARLQQTLTNGLKESALIMNSEKLQEIAIKSSLDAIPCVRMTHIEKRRGKPPRVIVYLNRHDQPRG